MIPRRDNYAIMAEQCRSRFLTYDQSVIIENAPLTQDETWFYLPVLNRICRIHRPSGHLYWPPGYDSPSRDHSETFTIFDYLCDADPDRSPSGTFVSMASLGQHTHTSLLSPGTASSLEAAIDRDPDAFRRACTQMGGTPCPGGDLAFSLFLFPDLPIQLRFWHADEEFPPQLQLLWDANALSYIRYETTYYAASMIRTRLSAQMALSDAL